MMAGTGTDGSKDVGDRSVRIQIETEEDVSTCAGERKRQPGDSVLECLSPLITSVRPLGLYFTRRLVDSAATSQHDRNCIGGCRQWSGAQVYSTTMLALTWFSAARNCIIIHGTETVGSLFTKLGMNSGVLLNAFLHTAYYVACHTGSLDRVFRDVDSSQPDFYKKCSRRVKVVTVACWLLATTGIVYYVFVMFTRDYFYDLLLMFLIQSFRLSTQRVGLYVAKAVCALLHLPSIAVCSFTQAMNFVVVSLLYDQFDQLNRQFSKCIGVRGQFSGDFAEFRRRHYAISLSVQEADRFLRISNGVYLCCQIVTIILVFYNTVFVRDDLVLPDPAMGVLFVAWLIVSVFGLALTAGQAVILNHKVSIS